MQSALLLYLRAGNLRCAMVLYKSFKSISTIQKANVQFRVVCIPTGRRYDENGNLRQWWSDETLKHYHAKVECIIRQYSGYHLPDLGNNFTVSIFASIIDALYYTENLYPCSNTCSYAFLSYITSTCSYERDTRIRELCPITL